MGGTLAASGPPLPSGASEALALPRWKCKCTVWPLCSDSELIAALSLRRFYVEFAAADLEELLESLDRSVGLLDEQL